MFYSKNSKELVFDLIAQDNPQIQPRLSADNCVIEAITTQAANAANGNKNTQARVRGLQGSGFSGSVLVRYNRINLPSIVPTNDFRNGSRILIQNFAATSSHAILPQFSLQYGINLNTWDFANTSLANPGVAGATVYYNYVAASNNPAYVGTLPVVLLRGQPSLADQITVRQLTEYAHPDKKVDALKSAALATWGLDFTDNSNLINGSATVLNNWTALRSLLDSYGVPAFDKPASVNNVAYSRTTSVSGSNTAFTYVTVISGILSAECAGNAYLHFN